MSDEKRAALSELLQSEGWKYLKGYAVQAWGAKATLDQLAQTAMTATNFETVAGRTVKLLGQRDAIDELLGWPEREIAHLDKAEKKPA